MNSGAVASQAAPEMPCRKGRRSAASESCRLRRDEDARPHIARNSGLFTFWRRAGAHLRFSRKFWFGWQAAGRQAGFRSGRLLAARDPSVVHRVVDGSRSRRRCAVIGCKRLGRGRAANRRRVPGRPRPGSARQARRARDGMRRARAGRAFLEASWAPSPPRSRLIKCSARTAAGGSGCCAACSARRGGAFAAITCGRGRRRAWATRRPTA